MDAEAIAAVVSGHTSLCFRLKDDSYCRSYFAPDGRFERRMVADDKRRSGRWESEQGRLCLIWNNKPKKRNCWDFAFSDEHAIYVMSWKGAPKILVCSLEPGDHLERSGEPSRCPSIPVAN